MTTVPKSDTPAPADNSATHLVHDDGSDAYGRPTAGNNAGVSSSADGGGGLGPPPTDSDAPAGETPTNPIMGGVVNAPPDGDFTSAANDPGNKLVQAGADPSVGNTQVGPNFGHGATIIMAQPDATGHPASDTAGGGTVGDSGKGLGQ